MLRIENLTKIYGEHKAVDDLSLHIAPGEIYGFIGHNGAGKTTTLKSVAGILRFDAGEIFINGKSIKADPVGCKREMAYIPDNPDMYEFLSGIKYLNFVADIYGMTKAEREERITKYADMFEITKDLAQPVSAYSHGMKQKLAIISALMHKPKLLLMDEPFVGLDPIAAHQLKGIMRELCDEGGAIFFSTHVLEVAEKLCDKVAIIKGGKLLKSGSMEQVKGDASLENVFLDAKGGKKPSKIGGIGIAILLIYAAIVFAGMFSAMFFGIAELYHAQGIGWLYFALAGILAAGFCLMGSVFTAQTQLYNARDNEMLLAMPIPSAAILGSRMIMLLLLNYFYEAIVAIPAIAVWIAAGLPVAVSGAVCTAVGFIILPLLPLTLSCLLGGIIAAITARMRHKNIITLVSSLLFLAVYMYFYTNMQTYIQQLMVDGLNIADAFERSIPPFYWLGNAAADGDFVKLVLFVLCCVVPFGILYAVLSKSFIGIATERRSAAKKVYKGGEMRTGSAFMAVVKKELARFVSSAGYMINAGMGIVMMVAAAVFMAVKRAQLIMLLDAIGTGYAGVLVGLIVCALVSMVFISAPSISLEGKSLWVMQTMPIRGGTVLRAKAAMHIMITAPAAVLCTAAMGIIANANALDCIAAALLAVAFAVFTAYFGVALNLKIHRFDWIN